MFRICQPEINEEYRIPSSAPTPPQPAPEVITEVFDTSSPLSNISEVPNEHELIGPQPFKYVYYYCGGLDVSGGGVIDCATGVREDGDVKADGGVTEGGNVGATEADDLVDATPHSTLRYMHPRGK